MTSIDIVIGVAFERYVSAVQTSVTVVFTWKVCNEDIDYLIYLN
jgi:hypothetical protein